MTDCHLAFHSSLSIADIELADVNIPLDDEFIISRGKLLRAEVTYVRLRFSDGVEGYGEIAPFPDLTGETRDASRAVAARLAREWIGKPAAAYRRLILGLYAAAPEAPAACCGLETALLDACARAHGIPLWAFWGGAAAHRILETDITLPILGLERTLELARQWYDRGFRLFKTKVGANPEGDCKRIGALAEEFVDVAFILDANQAFTEKAARSFLERVQYTGARVALFEQPVDRHDLDGMAALCRDGCIPVVADESVTSPREALEVVARGAADIINLKIMKSGVLAAIDIAAIARAAGLGLMIGGMMETRLAMGCSLALAYGLGGIDWLDLDTPLLMTEDPVEGGFAYKGPQLNLWTDAGLGLTPRIWSPR